MKALPRSILAAGLQVIVLVYVLADILAQKLQLESIFDAVIEKFLRRAQNRRRSILVPPASTSAYVKLLPKTLLAAGLQVIV